MKRNCITLVLGLMLAFSLVACTSEKAPNVTPTPHTTVTTTPGMVPETGKPEVSAPMETNSNYNADGDGHVEGTTPPTGTTTHNGVTRAVDDAGRAVKHAVDDAGRAVRDMGRDAEHAIR